MSSFSGVGNSIYTEIKYRRFVSFILKHLYHHVHNYKAPYHFIDLTAGDGTGCILAFIKAARKIQKEYPNQKFVIIAFEKNKLTFSLLWKRIKKYQSKNMIIRFQKNNSENFFTQYCLIGRDLVSKYGKYLFFSGWPNFKILTNIKYGLIFSDPNGITYFNHFIAFLRYSENQNIDLLLNYCGNCFKRNRKTIRRQKFNLYDCVKIFIKKEFWGITDIIGSWQWAMIYGTNNDSLLPYLKDFYDIQTHQGSNILYRLNYSKRNLRLIKKEGSTKSNFRKKDFLRYVNKFF